MNNNSNGSSSKGSASASRSGAAAAPAAQYKSLSSASSSSSSADQPIYRGLSQVATAAPSINKEFQQRGMVAAHQAKNQQSLSSSPASAAVIVNQDLEHARQKAAQAASVATTKSEAVKTTTDDVFVARDFPIIGFPLSQSFVVVSNPTKLDPAMKAITKALKGQSKPNKGSIKAQRENETEIKVCAYRDTKTGKIYIEFNRLDGCAFTFQKAFVEAKLAAAEFLDNVDVEETKAELGLIDRKLSFWYGQDNALLAALLPGISADE